MRKLTASEKFTTVKEAKINYLNNKNIVESRHWQIIWLSLKGKSAYEIADCVGYYSGWVKEVIRRYNKQGSVSVRDNRKKNGGKNILLTISQRKELIETIYQTRASEGLWTGPKVAEWLSKKLGRKVKRQIGWNYLQRLGFSLQTARPFHIKADKKKQEEFKKKFQKK